MSIKVGINGFGRIGRNVLRACCEDRDLEFVAVNDITNAETLAHLLKYDSVHGRFNHTVSAEKDALVIDGRTVRVLSERDPAKLPWSALGVQIVLECSGLFTSKDKAAAHLAAGAKKVLISAPAKGVDLTICYGVNQAAYRKDQHHVLSNASCTTNCLAPVAKVVHETFGIRKGWMTTIHSYTNDQNLLDLPHRDLRRARAAALSMIPTTTGAASALGEVIPDLKGKLDGFAMRVPTPNVSVVDLALVLDKKTTAEQVNATFKAAADGPLKGILEYCTAPLVSLDFRGNPRSSIVDAPYTKVMDGDFAKVLAWYDNEWGYSCRCVDLAQFIARKGL